MSERGKKLSKPRKRNIKKPFISVENKEKIEDRIIRDIWKLFEQKKKKKKERNHRKRKKQNVKINEDKIIRDIRRLFEQEDYFKPNRVNSFWNNNYTEYESNGDKNRDLSLDAYLNKIKTYLRTIIIGLQSSDTWKIQLKIAINFISSKHTEEERVMSDNRKFTCYNNANEVVNALFESLRSKYQDNLETSMRGNYFTFESVQLM